LHDILRAEAMDLDSLHPWHSALLLSVATLTQWIDLSRPHPEGLRAALLRAAASKDGSWHDCACGRPSRRRALKERAPPQDEALGCAPRGRSRFNASW